MMTLKELKNLGQWIRSFLALFADCFKSVPGRQLLSVYVKGQLSDVTRKNCEGIALSFGESPRTLQRFLESLKWNEEMLRDRCQQIIATDHAHPEAIGLIDESGTTKSGQCTASASRQYNGNRGKIENCTVGVHLGYATPGFQAILDSRLYLPKDWADDPQRREEAFIPDEVEFQTKPQIAIDMVDRAIGNGVCVSAWTCDELYGRDSAFLDALEERQQAFVAEIPSDTRVWTMKPRVIHTARPHCGRGRPLKTPCVAEQPKACQVRNLLKHSPTLRKQPWERYRIKDTHKGPEVWEIKSLTVWRKTSDKLPSDRQTLIFARNVRTGEIKFFLSNQVVGEKGVTLVWLLRVAFGRWAIEACFRLAKEELGMDHFEVRGWRCIHRHYYVTGLSFLMCSRIRQSLDENETGDLTVEQVRRSINVWLQHNQLPPPLRDKAFTEELDRQSYHQKRNATAQKSHTKTRIKFYHDLGIDLQEIKSCIP